MICDYLNYPLKYYCHSSPEWSWDQLQKLKNQFHEKNKTNVYKKSFFLPESFREGHDVDKRFFWLELFTSRFAWALDIRISWIRSWMREICKMLSSEMDKLKLQLIHSFSSFRDSNWPCHLLHFFKCFQFLSLFSFKKNSVKTKSNFPVFKNE